MEEKIKTGDWLHVCNDEAMSLIPQCYCSQCGHIISTYYPPKVCEHCGSVNIQE